MKKIRDFEHQQFVSLNDRSAKEYVWRAVSIHGHMSSILHEYDLRQSRIPY